MGLSVPITVYTRKNCPLCEEVERVVTDFAGRFVLTLEFRDIDDRQEWRQAYGQEVPVVFIGDEKAFRFRIDAQEFEDRVLEYFNRFEDADQT